MTSLHQNCLLFPLWVGQRKALFVLLVRWLGYFELNYVEVGGYYNVIQSLIIVRPYDDGPFTRNSRKWPRTLAILSRGNGTIRSHRLPPLNQFKCTSVSTYDHRYKKNRKKLYYGLRDLFGFKDQDTLPLGIYRDSTAGNLSPICRQRERFVA